MHRKKDGNHFHSDVDSIASVVKKKKIYIYALMYFPKFYDEQK